MVNGEVATVIDKAWVAVWAVGVEWSVTCTVNEDVPDPDGVPLKAPVDEFRETPVGSVPVETDHE
jgi:hypothetical protein